MNSSPEKFLQKHAETLITFFSIGVFLILIGVIFSQTPQLLDKIIDFFKDFTLVKIPKTWITLPAPSTPANHRVLYMAFAKFSLYWGFFQFIVLGSRLIVRSPLNKKAETVSDIIFWLGASYLVRNLLDKTITKTAWFTFWALIIVLIGTTLVVRGIILLAQK